jgi:replicative DNA helicase
MKARSLKRQHGLDLLVIDYLQLLAVERRTENRTAAMSEISRSLKVLAKELDIPIIALSQLNRACEGRPDKRPLLSDLRETGAIEQDADLVIFIYRDEVYDEESPDCGTAELLIRKNRNGPIGEIRVAWQAQQTRFMDIDHFVQD